MIRNDIAEGYSFFANKLAEIIQQEFYLRDVSSEMTASKKASNESNETIKDHLNEMLYFLFKLEKGLNSLKHHYPQVGLNNFSRLKRPAYRYLIDYGMTRDEINNAIATKINRQKQLRQTHLEDETQKRPIGFNADLNKTFDLNELKQPRTPKTIGFLKEPVLENLYGNDKIAALIKDEMSKEDSPSDISNTESLNVDLDIERNKKPSIGFFSDTMVDDYRIHNITFDKDLGEFVLAIENNRIGF